MLLTGRLNTLKRLSAPSWTPKALRVLGLVGLLAMIVISNGGPVGTAATHDSKHRHRKPRIKFQMVRSAAAENGNCLADAQADVRVTSLGPVELMNVDVRGLPPNTDFDFFV